MVCSEFAPLAKTGGLADAVAGLSRALAQSGHDVRILLPKYAGIGTPPRIVDTIVDRDSGLRIVEARLAAGAGRIYLLDMPELFGGDQIYSGDDSDAARFLALADGAVRFGALLGWTPDIVHCHDWHAALVPVMLRGSRAPKGSMNQKTILTLHNIGYQGTFGEAAVDTQRYPELDVWIDRSGPSSTINFLRAGISAADLLTTVSPTYALEIQTSGHGMGLEDVLSDRRGDLVGILNGVDYSVWDPRTDPFIDTRYDRNDPLPKLAVKRSLFAAVGLPEDSARPLIGVVTRLASQKGIDLLIAALPALLRDSQAAFAVLGSGDAVLERELADFAAREPARIAYTRGHDEALAHRILAGSDIVLVPSRYEPCGLPQLYALRYGSIPVVRSTGGLADTIQHFDVASGRGNGAVFEDADPQGLIWGISQALAWFGDTAIWQRLIDNAMSADFSWQKQVGAYTAIYDRLLKPQ
jgi:starch synthase